MKLLNAVEFALTVIIITALIMVFLQSHMVTKSEKATPEYSNIMFDDCNLPQLNPWDPSIIKFLKPNTNPKCESTFEQLTVLNNGILTTTSNDSDSTCMYRCLDAVNDSSFTPGFWEYLTDSAYPTCDIIETKCTKHNESTPFYEFVHAQIYRNETANAEKTPDLPDVHVILLDSVSHSAFIRTLSRTYHELMANYEAIPFPHLNKVGHGSRPNALAAFFGKSDSEIEKSSMSVGYASDFHGNDSCEKPLDDDQFIGKQFKSAGYTTMMGEDWALGAFTYPNCKGFVKKATDHMMKPFQLKADFRNKKSVQFYRNVYANVCQETFDVLFGYLKDFVDAYPDKPKFSITWITDVSHNDNNMMYHADNRFYEFFRKNEANFNNSFVFVMGDHGMRFGGIRETNLGELEDNNPFLMLSLPWNLRQNGDTLAIVRKNARQLTTHYDVYATLVEIADPEKNSAELVVHGSSLLRPLPQPRTCDRLRVPFEYCTCIRTKTKLLDDNNVGKVAASKMVEQMNQAVSTDNSTKDLCATLTLNQDIAVVVEQFISKEQFKTDENLSVYEVTYTVQPGNGRFKGFVGQKGNSSDIKILSSIARLNSYDSQAFCAKTSTFRAFCFCKSLLH